MADTDAIVCFELPCHAQQSRTWKPDPDPSRNPLILPVFMCKDQLSSRSYNRTLTNFTNPFVIVLDSEQAKDRDQIYAAIVDRLQRWAKNAKDLYRWEHDMDMEQVPIPTTRSTTTVTEIKENGDIITVQEEEAPEEGDIVDAKSIILEDQDCEAENDHVVPRRAGPKSELFTLHFQSGLEKYATGSQYASSQRWERWESREGFDGERKPLLREGDALHCEWDDHVRSYYFSDERDSARWDEATWDEFIHPEFEEAQKAALARKNRGITLQDCLEEFTKEEQLGEDDLWYCPRCKKHQQATKKFDIWAVPDILVVHLKRFSNSRMLRDKIDAFVDFPVEGLDLEAFCVEREVTKRIAAQANSVDGSGLTDLGESVVYDLYAVDEHLGGLGGGHYRAYAKVHSTGKWYHFDDSFVNSAQASDAVVSSLLSAIKPLLTHATDAELQRVLALL